METLCQPAFMWQKREGNMVAQFPSAYDLLIGRLIAFLNLFDALAVSLFVFLLGSLCLKDR